MHLHKLDRRTPDSLEWRGRKKTIKRKKKSAATSCFVEKQNKQTNKQKTKKKNNPTTQGEKSVLTETNSVDKLNSHFWDFQRHLQYTHLYLKFSIHRNNQSWDSSSSNSWTWAIASTIPFFSGSPCVCSLP